MRGNERGANPYATRINAPTPTLKLRIGAVQDL